MLQILMILSFICSLDLLSARPAEEPIKFTFDNIRNNTENTIPSKSEERKEILEHVADAIRIGQGRFINLIILTRNIIANRAKINNEFRNNFDQLIIKSDKLQSRRSIPPIRSTTPIILFPPMEQETIRLENETAQAILERRKPDNIRQLLNRFLTPKPLVDRIKEEEKYGNTGDKFTGVEKAVINGYENFSNFLNLLTDFPVGIAKQTSRGITEILNELGARIIGLQ
ncbi:uncharacterized protein LOC105837304 isoform X2 [Monomorium pharaonis]|uniref:uncharacterized protein LOC105837304 isoform X2 n=1 Tax=Monomorium pharaonis TaxID=307658 RepID=UPI00174680C1|nr:uncharacterized protein LOC105837304 isoform X2 [Monomorium pharaonis]